jgi:hypothetical protein
MHGMGKRAHDEFNPDATAARLAVLRVAVQEIARQLSAEQASAAIDAIGARLGPASAAVTARADAAMAAKLAAVLEVLCSPMPAPPYRALKVSGQRAGSPQCEEGAMRASPFLALLLDR